MVSGLFPLGRAFPGGRWQGFLSEHLPGLGCRKVSGGRVQRSQLAELKRGAEAAGPASWPWPPQALHPPLTQPPKQQPAGRCHWSQPCCALLVPGSRPPGGSCRAPGWVCRLASSGPAPPRPCAFCPGRLACPWARGTRSCLRAFAPAIPFAHHACLQRLPSLASCRSWLDALASGTSAPGPPAAPASYSFTLHLLTPFPPQASSAPGGQGFCLAGSLL